MTSDDNEIIDRIRKGAKHQFAQLVDRYKNRAMTLAIRMLRNREDAEEAAQDAFIRAYNALDKFQGAAKFSTWFYRILHNVCLTKLGKRCEEFHSLDYDDELHYDAIELATVSSIVTDYELKDLIHKVQEIIADMPEKYGTMLSLFYLQELSHKEICEVTQLPLGTVKTHLFRARAILQERFLKEFQSEKVLL
jgi:RNA polymerase sigma factor (sigma-70 family)